MLKHKKRKRKSFVLLLREAAASTAETWAHVSAPFLLAVGCWKCSLQPTAVGCTEPGMELRDIGFRNKMVGHCCSKSSLKWGSIYWLSSPSCSPAAEVFGLRRYAFFHSAGLGLSTRIINSDYRPGFSMPLPWFGLLQLRYGPSAFPPARQHPVHPHGMPPPSRLARTRARYPLHHPRRGRCTARPRGTRRISAGMFPATVTASRHTRRFRRDGSSPPSCSVRAS